MNTVDTNKLIATDAQNLVIQEQEALLQGLIDKIVGTNLDVVTVVANRLEKEVIFESDINGIKYYIVRCCPKLNAQFNLSPREQAIAQLVAAGLPNKMIANQLQISPWTVASHLRRMFIKLGVSSRTAMISRLLEQNQLPQN